MRNSLALLALTLLWPVAAGNAQSGPPPVERRLVVKDVMPAPALNDPREHFTWYSATPLGAGSSSAPPAYLATGVYANATGRLTKDVLTIETLAYRREPFSVVRPTDLAFEHGAWTRPNFAVLREPGGPVLVTDRGYDPPPHIFHLPQLNPLGKVILPPPPHKALQIIGFRGRWWAGDLQGDGYDDMFFQGVARVSSIYIAGLVDGRSRTVVWQDYLPYWETDSPVTQHNLPGPPPDLDGDGVPDFVSAVTSYVTPGQLPFLYRMRALSGLDGALIWERSIQTNQWFTHVVLGPDLTGDGVADLAGAEQDEAGTIFALDGTDGSFLWQIDNRILDPFMPPTTQQWWFAHPSFFTGALRTPGMYELCLVSERSDASGVRDYGVAYLDPADGTLLEFIGFPPDLQPWLPDSLDVITATAHEMLGDLDNDGFTDINRGVIDWTHYVPGYYWSWHFAILGQQTLFTPAAIQDGDPLPLTISIPKHAGRSFRLLLSDVFDAGGGRNVAGWNSNLGDSPLLRWSARQAIGGTLDATGEATLTLTLPSGIPLAGRTLYSRAFILDPAHPGEALTLSTLGRTEVQP